MIRPYIHRYTLRLKIIKSRSKEEEQQLIQATLQKFFDIVLQANSKTIIPPFLELDRNEKSIPDLSSAFQVSAVDSFYSLKKYFVCMSPRDEAGIIWCSIILAQSNPFSIFMEKVKYSLDNNAFSLWPKASDNETATDIGWFLNSTRMQDEDCIASLLTTLTNKNIGVKWNPIHTTNGPNRKKDPADSSEWVYTLNVEYASDRVQETKKKLAVWYDSSSSTFPDGTKMRLVPVFSSVLSMINRMKFASCLARHVALSAGLGTCTTWEMSTNLMLDKIDPISRRSFRELMMSITPENSSIPLFHTIDKQWWSENVVTFTFQPEHKTEARLIVAGLIPFLRDEGHKWFLRMFSTEAQQRHASSRWDSATRQVFSIEEAELAEFLAANDELNFTNEPTQERPESRKSTNTSQIEVEMPSFIPDDFPSMQIDDDSNSTFHPRPPPDKVSYEDFNPIPTSTSTSTSMAFNPIITSLPPTQNSIQPRNIKNFESDSVSKLSDTASRISSLETNLKELDEVFKNVFLVLRMQGKQHEETQSKHEKVLDDILQALKLSNTISNSHPSNVHDSINEANSSTSPHASVLSSEVANNPQMRLVCDSSGVASHC